MLAQLALLWYVPTFEHGPLFAGVLLLGLVAPCWLFVRSFHGGTSVATPRASRVALALLAVSGVALVGHDVSGPRVAYEYSHQVYERVEFHGSGSAYPGAVVYDQDVRVAEVAVRNDFAFTRSVELPEYEACVVGDDSDRVRSVSTVGWVSGDLSADRVGAGESAQMVVDLEVDVRGDSGSTVEAAVERSSECDADPGRLAIRYWRTG